MRPCQWSRSDAALGYSLAFEAMTTSTRQCRCRYIDLTHEGGCILSPRILGLRNPPQAVRELRVGDETILDVPQIGGIFMAVPGWVYGEFRYNESNPLYGRDDVDICHWWRMQGGTCGYVKRLEAWHYRTTDGQHDDYDWYFERRVAEGGPA